MHLIHQLNNFWRPAQLTRGRMAFALAVAIIADGLQMALGPLGWFGTVQFLDVVAMVLSTLALGFHLLLLPTFVLEFIPLVDMIPTWTGCVVAVIALRKRSAATPAVVSVSDPPPPPLPLRRLAPPESEMKPSGKDSPPEPSD